MLEKYIEVKNINYTINNIKILNDISLNIFKGDSICILGKNGSGKTTFIKTITNLLQINAGHIYIKGKDINEYKKKKLAKIISYIPQSLEFSSVFSVEDIILMGRIPYLRLMEEYKEEDYKICEHIMKELNILHLKNRNIMTLSGGERQKVYIARALVQNAEIIVLDEPISELDIGSQLEVMQLLYKLNKEKGITIICVIHDLNIALKFFDKTIFIDNGTIYSYEDTRQAITEKNIKDIYGIELNVNTNGIYYI